MRENLRTFEDLECWKACVEVKNFINELIKTLPSSEKYELVDNLRRASRSTTRNIAEGFGRFHYKENVQFCRHSRGSLFEILDDLITCEIENYITKEQLEEGRAKINRALKLLNGYINYLKKAQEQLKINH